MGLGTFIGELFGTKSTAKTVEHATAITNTLVEGAVKGLDAIFYTDEEKEAYQLETKKIHLKFLDTFAKENSQQSLARRELAKQSFMVWFMLIIMGVLCRIFGVIVPEMIELAAYIFEIVTKITWLIGMVAGTYFVPHQVSKVFTFHKGENQ